MTPNRLDIAALWAAVGAIWLHADQILVAVVAFVVAALNVLIDIAYPERRN